MNKLTIFIDESGTLPDVKDQVIIIAAVSTNTPNTFTALINKMHKQIASLTPLTELKFYTAGDKTKKAFFEQLIKEDVAIFILIVDKKGRKIADTPLHFAILAWLILSEVTDFYPHIKEVIFDRHFHKKEDLENFNKMLKQLLQSDIPLRHVDSQQTKQVNVADMIAGATLAKMRGKNATFYEIFEEKIISELKVNWPEIKRIALDKQKLARTGASTHPKRVK